MKKIIVYGINADKGTSQMDRQAEEITETQRI